MSRARIRTTSGRPPDRVRKALACIDPQTLEYCSRATIGEKESETKSGGETFVAMMQATDFWDSDDSSDAAMLNRAGVGAILVERKMRAGAVVVVDVRRQDATQMTLVEDHQVIETLAPHRTDHALDVSVLPR